MRELKFRAFIKGKNIIRPVAYLKFSDDNELMTVGVFNNNHEISEFIPEDVAIDQSTGLKDKNGNEIYEGDIKTIDLLKILPQQPAFGDKTGKTRWLFFIKEVI